MSRIYHLTSGEEPEAVTLEALEHDGKANSFSITRASGEPVLCKASRRGDRLFLQVGHRSVDCVVRKLDEGYEISVEGRTIFVGVLSDTELRRKRVAGGGIADDATVVTSPMAGRVVKILASPGDEVQEGESLLIVEAMKMENEIKAGRPGVISGIDVSEADTVEVGSVLVRFEEDAP